MLMASAPGFVSALPMKRTKKQSDFTKQTDLLKKPWKSGSSCFWDNERDWHLVMAVDVGSFS